MTARDANLTVVGLQESDPPFLPFFPLPGLDAKSGGSLVRVQNRDLKPESQYETRLAASHTQDLATEGIAIWRAHVEKLSEEERNRFLKYSATDVKHYVAALEQAVKQQSQKSRAVKVAQLIKPVFETMNMYAPIARTMVQVDPSPSALVLGGITCVMSISSRFLDYQENMARMLSEMLQKLDVLPHYSTFVYQSNTLVQKALLNIYGDILQFCLEASKLFLNDDGKPRSSLKAFLTSLWQPFESKFGEIGDKFDRDLKAFEDRAKLCDRLQFKFITHQAFEANQSYRDVVSVGQEMLAATHQRQSQEIEKQKAETDKIREERRRQITAWLPSISFRKDQRDKYSRRLEGTGQWLLKKKTFQSWKTKSTSELLWVHGKHGSGKSHLCALVVQHLSEASERTNESQKDFKDTALAYIYCNSLNEAKIDPSTLIGSILKQLCDLLPKFYIEPSLDKLFDSQSELPSGEDMQQAVIATMGRFSQTFIIVDGLDECHNLEDGQFEELCKFMRLLTQPAVVRTVAKVLVFSRPEYVEITTAFEGCRHIQVDAGANDEDIMRFISKKISGKDLHVRQSPSLLREAKAKLLSGADGMFLWVDLLVKTLKGERTQKEIMAKLNNLPQGLHNVYELSMKRVLDQKESVRKRALKILLWTTNAKRPLSQSELLEALAVEPEMRELDDEDKILDDDGFPTDCGDLIVLVDSHYHLLHSSLKEYLRNLPASGSDPLKEYRHMQENAERILGETCLTYLKFGVFEDGPVDDAQGLAHLQEKNPFLKYASEYWGCHVAATKGTDLQELTISFLTSNGARELSMQVFMLQRGKKVCPYPPKTTPLHLLSIFNLVDLTKSLPSTRLLKSERDGFKYLPLSYALFEGSKDMCNWLLENTDDTTLTREVLDYPHYAIHLAAKHNWSDVIERLLLLGCDPELKWGPFKETPLHFAASRGSEYALTALLNAKVDVNAVDIDGRTPLIVAAECNHPRLVTMLLDAGAQVNLRGLHGTTALHRAADHGNVHSAKQLLQRGAEIDPVSGKEWGNRTPLHVAAEEGSTEILELLINKGADIERSGPAGHNAFLLTCGNGFLACLELLLQANAQVDARNNQRRTGFHLAAMCGHSEILKALFKKHPDRELINSGDDRGNTPLHAAISRGNWAESRLLLENGALVDKVDNEGVSCLHIAVIEGDDELAELLLNTYKADARLKDTYGCSALHYAAKYGHSHLISLLLAAGGNPDAADNHLETALHSAARENKLDFIKRFIEDVPTLELAPKNKDGRTPLHIAALGGFSELVSFFLQHQASRTQTSDNEMDLPLHLATWNGHREAAILLLDEGNVNSQGRYGGTPLAVASARGHSDLVNFLLAKGADANKLDYDQQSPLLLSVRNGHADIATILLNNKADPKLANKDGRTALHEAAAIGDKIMVIKLLDVGCDGLYAANSGETPFMCAVSSRKVEVVDAFLDRGFNGTVISDISGYTCIHVAAYNGSIQLLEKLTTISKETATATDCIGWDALDHAAAAGQVHMIEPLRELGIGVNGLGKGEWRPLHIAASAGFYDFVCRLIELGADLNDRVGPEETSPLLLATSRGRPLIAERLLKAGANPTDRDAFGLNSLDYAYRDPQVWQKMGDWTMAHNPTGLPSRVPMLWMTVRKCIKTILAQSQTSDPKSEDIRISNLAILAAALVQMNTNSSRGFAKLCYTELTSPLEFGIASWKCNMCLQTELLGVRYLCTQCIWCQLCSDCYADYLKGAESPKSVPQSLKTLRKLEDDLKPVRQIGKRFLHFGARFLLYSCELLTVVEWIDEKLKEYEDWEHIYKGTGLFNNHERPGQWFLQLIQKARQAAEKEKGQGEDGEGDPFSATEEQLGELYRQHKPDREDRNFVCSGHEYLEIRGKSAEENAVEKFFDAHGKLTAEWLSELLKIYQDDGDEGGAGGQTMELRTLPQHGSETENVNVEVVAAEPDIHHSIWTHVVHETENAGEDKTEGKRKLDHKHKSLRGGDGPIQSSTSEEKTKSASARPPTNRWRLENIRQKLKDHMVELIKEAKVSGEMRVLPRSEISTDPQSERPDNMEPQNLMQKRRCGSQNNQDKGSDKTGQESDSTPGKYDATTTLEDIEPDQRLQYVYRISDRLDMKLWGYQMAWELAQTILVGSVESNLFHEVLVDDNGLEDQKNSKEGTEERRDEVGAEEKDEIRKLDKSWRSSTI